MGAAVVRRHDFEVLEARTPVPVLVFDAGVWEVDVPVFFVRQQLLLCPADDLLRVAIRSTVTVPLAAIALVEEPLVVPLHLVVEHDAPNASAVATNALLSALVGTVDVDVVGQLARLPEAGVELLTGLVCSAVAWNGSVGFEEVPAAVGEDDGSVVGIEWRPPNQTRVFEVSYAVVRLAGVVPQGVQVVLGHNSERAHGPQHPRLGAIDVVNPVAVSDWLTLGAPRKFEVTCEDIARVTLPAISGIAAATAAAIEVVASVASIMGAVVTRVVAVEHAANMG